MSKKGPKNNESEPFINADARRPLIIPRTPGVSDVRNYCGIVDDNLDVTSLDNSSKQENQPKKRCTLS